MNIKKLIKKDKYLKFIKELDLPDEKKELIMWKNAAPEITLDVVQVVKLPPKP